MTEIYTYICDICGEEFDNEKDCRRHEMEHTAAMPKNAVVMMDCDGKILSLDNIRFAINRSNVIYVGCKEAAKMLWDVFENEGYSSPVQDIETPIQYPALFIYDENADRWLYFRDIEEEYNHYLELKAIAEKTLLH